MNILRSLSRRGCSSCEGVNRTDCRYRPLTERSSNRSFAAERYPGFKSSAHGRYWAWPPVIVYRRWPGNCNARHRRSGAWLGATSKRDWHRSWPTRRESAARPTFPPVQRAQIVQLACLEPIAKGLHITHWSSEALARQAVLERIVPAISARTVRRLLRDVDIDLVIDNYACRRMIFRFY